MEEGWELQDWEVLQNSEEGVSIPSDSSEASRDFRGMEEDGIITSNYFSLDSQSLYEKTRNLVEEGSGSVHSENPSWVDPTLGFQRKNSSEFWSDSGSDGSGSGSNKFKDSDGKHQLGFQRIDEIGGFQGQIENFDQVGFRQIEEIGDFGEVGFGKIDEIGGFKGKGVDFWVGSSEDTQVIEKFSVFREEDKYGFGEMGSGSGGKVLEFGEGVELMPADGGEHGYGKFDRFCSDSGGEIGNKTESGGLVEEDGGVGLEPAEFVERSGGEFGTEKYGQIDEESDSRGNTNISAQGELGGAGIDIGSESGGGVLEEGGNVLEAAELVDGNRGENTGGPVLESDEGQNKSIIWWKLPFEMLKFCVFRVSPVWSISVAAAVLGFVILRRRLHRMKKKTRSIPLKITVEDKKVSQFMIRAARLNEAFSVVRRVPIIRPAMPATGLIPWHMMT